MRILSAGGKVRSWAKRLGSRASSARGSCSSTGLMSSTRCRRATPLFQLLAHPRHQAAHTQQLVHKLGKRLAAILIAFREVADDAFLEVDLELVSLLDALRRLRRLEDRVTHVDGVAKEDARERVGYHQRDAGAADGNGRDLAGRSAAEIRAADQDVAGRDLRGPRLAARHAIHRVLAELLLVERVDRVLRR